MNIGLRKLKYIVYIALAWSLAQIAAPGAYAAEPAPPELIGTEAGQAQFLLQRAVALYKEIKDLALEHFGPHGEFVSDELYVYVVSTSGVLLASGGPSSPYIGGNIKDQKDAVGKPFVREMLDKARTKGSGTVEYMWLNPASNKTERKIAFFQKVGDRVIAVGYYAP
ncbi:MAG TPA: cache domain-containing protein [Burkholderiales bacterium]|nr:cache domain-containing protein [Burkholderiales bacterium]